MLLLLITTTSLRAQDFVTRRSAQIVLDRMHNDIRREYFDSTFGGVNLDSLKRVARTRIKACKSDVEIKGLARGDQVLMLIDVGVLDVLKEARFTPALLDNVPVRVWVQLPIIMATPQTRKQK